MGYRTLVEFSHDEADRLFASPDKLVADLNQYMGCGGRVLAENLFYQYGMKVVAMRHSSDRYIIPGDAWGFPARLPWGEERQRRADAVTEARKVLTEARGRSMKDLHDIITGLLDVIEVMREDID